MNLEDLYTKYHVLTDGLCRKYIIDIHERRYDLDYVTPYELIFLVPNSWETNEQPLPNYQFMVAKKITNRAWTQLLKELVVYLQSKSPKTKEDLLSFRTDWSKASIFSEYKAFYNMVEIEERLFLSINFTSTHSTWVIKDLLNFYGLDIGYLAVHRTPVSEPQEIKDEIGLIRRREFKQFLMDKHNKSGDTADNIIKNFDSINKILSKMGTSYNDYFLFDDTLLMATIKAKMLKDIDKYAHWTESQISVVRKYLDYLTEYFTSVMKEAKKHKDNLIIPFFS